MILSYETLLRQWIIKKDYKSILKMDKSANKEIAHFIERDIEELLLEAEKTRCKKTIAALVKCATPRSLLEIRSILELEDAGRDIDVDQELFGVDAPKLDEDDEGELSEDVQSEFPDTDTHDLLLFVISEFLENDDFCEAMLSKEHNESIENETLKII